MASYEWDEDKRIMVPSSNGICSDITDNELMNILKTTSQYSDWPDSLKILHKKYSNFGYGGKFNRNSKKAQMVSFLVAHPKIALNRHQLEIVCSHLLPNINIGDIIQSVNKTYQNGLMRIRFYGTALYGFPFVRYDDSKIKSRDENLTSDKISSSTSYIRELGWHMMNDKLEKGHKNPNKPLDDSNVVMQPHCINAAYRDKYIFDDNGLPRIPNPSKLNENTDSIFNNDTELVALTISLMKACERKHIDLNDSHVKQAIKDEGYDL